MSEILAKLTPPRIRNIYPRTNLFEKIDNSRELAKVTWITAPAGSGKTTLIASYLQDRKIKSLWYQVDEGDADIASFFYYLGLGAKQFAPRRKKLPLLTPEYQDGVSGFTRHFFRELYALLKTDGVLVFDNTQDAGKDAELFTLLKIICEEIPHQGQVIFISRSLFPQSLSRLQLNEDLNMLDWSDIQLSRDESIGIAQNILDEKYSIDRKQLNVLYDYTDGWTTGFILYLRQLMQGELNLEELDSANRQLSFGNIQANMFDYFTNELFNRLEESTQKFLAQVVWLEKLTIRSANQLSQSKYAKPILTQLEKDNFFVTRKGFITPTYEFHPLFQQYLSAKSYELFDEYHVNELKEQSAKLLSSAGHYETAAKLYIATQNWLALKDIILAHAEEMEKQGRQHLLAHWIGLLPVDWISEDKYLLYWQGNTNIYVNPFAAYEQLKTAYSLFEKENNQTWCYRSWLGLADSLFLRQDEFNEVEHWIDKLESLRESGASYPSLEVRGRISIAVFNLMLFSCSQHEKFNYWLSEMEKLYRFVPIADVKCVAGSQLAMYYTFYLKSNEIISITEKLKKYADSEKVRPLARILALWAINSASWISAQPDGIEVAIQNARKVSDTYGMNILDIWVYSAATLSSLAHYRLNKAEQYLDMMIGVVNPERRFAHAHYLYLLAWLQMEQGLESKALASITETMSLLPGLNIPIIEGIASGAAAIMHTHNGNWDKAQEYIKNANHIFGVIDNKHLANYFLKWVSCWLEFKKGNIEESCKILADMFLYARNNNQYAAAWLLQDMKQELCVLALNHNIEVTYVKKFIRIYELQPKNNQAIPDNWPYPIKIHTLGRFSLLINDEPINAGRKASKKLLELLKVIIAFGGKDVNSEKITQALWPDQDGDAALSVFNTTLHRLRKLLGKDVIKFSEGKVTLNRDVCRVDIWGFERQLNHLIAYQSKTDSPTLDVLLTDLNNLFTLYQGQFLNSEEDHSWILATRLRLHQKLLKAITFLAHQLEKNNRYSDAISLYQRGLDIDDVNEEFYQGIMRCCLALDMTAEGIATYQRCRTNFQLKFNVNPSKATEQLRSSLIENK